MKKRLIYYLKKCKDVLVTCGNKVLEFVKRYISIDSKEKKIYFVLFLASIIVIISLLVSLLIHLIPSSKTDFSEYKNNVSIVNPTDVLKKPIDPVVDFEKLKKENWDVCGWIEIPNTNIDYPIMQSDDNTDDSFYLDHGFDKKKLFDGSIFISKKNDNDFNEVNTVIYGHNLKNKQMFSQLHKYKNNDFFNKNQYIYIYKPRHVYVYRVFAAVVFDDRDILSSYNFEDEDSISKFINDLKVFSKLKSGQFQDDFKLAGDNQIITLSTCTEKRKERFIVVAAKMSDQVTTK